MTIQNKVSTVTLMAGGDVGPVVKPVDQFAEKILPVFKQADIRFGQCECGVDLESISSQVQG